MVRVSLLYIVLSRIFSNIVSQLLLRDRMVEGRVDQQGIWETGWSRGLGKCAETAAETQSTSQSALRRPEREPYGMLSMLMCACKERPYSGANMRGVRHRGASSWGWGANSFDNLSPLEW